LCGFLHSVSINNIELFIGEKKMIEISNPESVGMSSSRINEIDATMQEFIDQGSYPGLSTLVARYGKVVHFGCYGKLDLATNKPVQPESLFRIYSLTKPVTSLAALMLYEEGHFNINDPVSKLIPEFKNFKVLKDSTKFENELDNLEEEITFWHLLTHTSGLGYGISPEPPDPIEEMYREANIFGPIATLQFPLPEIIQKVAELPLATHPGTTWHYSLAHDVLGYLIGLISGKPFDVFLRERIFEPLGMQDTSFYVPQDKLERFGPMYSASNEDGISILDSVATSPFIHPDIVPSGGSGLISNMPDYFRFMLMLSNGGELDGERLLRPDTVTEMTTNQLTGSAFPVRFSGGPWPGMGFGLGIGVQVTDAPPQVGWIGWSGTTAWIYPRDKTFIITMSQSHNFEASDTLSNMVREAITT
jgi:CubicO group peptidase (beta-lactamase class C family)